MRAFLAVLLLLGVAPVVPAAADSVIYDLNAPLKTEEVAPCESWKGDWEIRCLSDGGAAIGGTVNLINPGDETVAYSTQVWMSACGFSASGPAKKAEWLLPPGGTQDIKLDANAVSSGGGAGCTELFVFDCKVGGVATPCKKRLEVTLRDPTVWPTQPMRDCELLHGSVFRCLSWSLKQGVRYIPGPVELKRVDSAKELLLVSPQEWQSVCGSVGTENAHESVSLRSGESEAVHFKGYSGQFANWGDLCVEMFIGTCSLYGEGTPPKGVNCADYLHVTVQ